MVEDIDKFFVLVFKFFISEIKLFSFLYVFLLKLNFVCLSKMVYVEILYFLFKVFIFFIVLFFIFFFGILIILNRFKLLCGFVISFK